MATSLAASGASQGHCAVHADPDGACGRAGDHTHGPAQQNGTPPTETGTEANPPVAEAHGSQGGEPSTEENTPEQGNPGEEQGNPGETQAPEQTPPPAENQLAPGCYTVVVAFESSRGPTGAFGPWEPVSGELSDAGEL